MAYDPRPARVRPAGPQFPAFDRLSCAWSVLQDGRGGCRGQLPLRIRDSNWFQLERWQEDRDGGWERASTGERRRTRQRVVRRVGGAEFVENRAGWQRVTLPTHFHCDLNHDHVNVVQ